MDRRTFLKIAGIGSIKFASGCTSDPENRLFALIEAPDDMVPGKAGWYASTCRECPAGCGILAKNRGWNNHRRSNGGCRRFDKISSFHIDFLFYSKKPQHKVRHVNEK